MPLIHDPSPLHTVLTIRAYYCKAVAYRAYYRRHDAESLQTQATARRAVKP
jgi:hypothetical protein